MPRRRRRSKTTPVALLLLVGCAAIVAAPTEWTDRPRQRLRDALTPGQLLAMRVGQSMKSLPTLAWLPTATSPDQQDRIDALTAERDQWRQRCLGLLARQADLQEWADSAQQQLMLTMHVDRPSSLVESHLVEASLIEIPAASPAVDTPSSAGDVLIAAGRAAGVTDGDLLIEPAALLVDQGQDAGLHADQPVTTGRIVLGRLEHVGRWTSRVQRVTDAEYRGHARLIRETAGGVVAGAEGVLAGDGSPLCRLDLVRATEPVSVGDRVFTAGEPTLYFGEIVSAELRPGATHWEIEVRPAAPSPLPDDVAVVTTRISPTRLARSGKHGALTPDESLTRHPSAKR